jgi:hypothetical protein
MRRADLEHVIGAAANVVGESEFVVIGSQAILGPHPDAPAALLRSMEADIYPLVSPEKADLIDGALGDGSAFHRQFLNALCLEPHDLVLAKCAAGRERDWQFARDAIDAGLVGSVELLARVGEMDLDERQAAHLQAMLEGIRGDGN